MFLYAENLTSTQWDEYFKFVSEQTQNNPFAHTIPAKTAEDLKNKVLTRIQKRKNFFLIYTFWSENSCIASLEISIPPDPTEDLGYSYFLTTSTANDTLAGEIVNILEEVCKKNNLSKIRITCSDFNAQKVLLKSEAKWLIHDIVQELSKEDIDFSRINACIESGSTFSQNNNLSVSFHSFLSETLLDNYVEFYNSIVQDIIVFDRENGELPINKEILLDRYEQIKAQKGSAWYYVIQEEASSSIVAVTEVWHSNSKALSIDGGLTAVSSYHRKKGLALFLKSLMIKKISELLPEFEIINTANSAINYPILGLNAKLFFKKVAEEFIFEFSFKNK